MRQELVFKWNDNFGKLARETLLAEKFGIPYSRDYTKEKCLTLVKDDGIYVKNAYPIKGKKTPLEHGTVIYAKGFDPDKNDNVWEDTYQVCNDDFAENIYLNDGQLRAIGFHGANLRIVLTDTTVKCSVED